MKVLLVEDDYMQEDAIRQAIEGEFADQAVKVETLCTELEFRQNLDRIVASPPDIVILDGMIRWTDPSPDRVPQPDDVKEQGILRAGRRCERLLSERAPEIPVLLFTILERSDLGRDFPKGVSYLAKGADPRPLLDKIRSILNRRGSR